MRCSYCTTAKRPVWISPERVRRIAALIEATGDLPVDLNFHGGEPTLAWDRVEELALALAPQRAARRLSFNMCTNGTAMDAARARGMAVIALTGRDGGAMAAMLGPDDFHLNVAHPRTMRVQEVHILALHCLCDLVDNILHGEPK